MSQAAAHVDQEALAQSLVELQVPDGDSVDLQAGIERVVRGAAGVFAGSGVGPCVDSFVLDTRVMTEDLHTEARWPELRAQLRDEPIRAVLGLPTHVGAPVGTLNLYSDRPRVWHESEIGALEAYNDLLEARLGGALLARQHGHIVDQLQ